MTLPNRDEMWRWLASAPLPVVLSICLTTTGALGSWVWALNSDIGAQKVAVAVAVEQAAAADRHTQSITNRLERIEDKLDQLIDAVAELKAKEKTR